MPALDLKGQKWTNKPQINTRNCLLEMTAYRTPDPVQSLTRRSSEGPALCPATPATVKKLSAIPSRNLEPYIKVGAFVKPVLDALRFVCG